MAKKQNLRIIPLGGLEEIGKNITAFEYGNDIIVLDCGMAFPDDEIKERSDYVLSEIRELLKTFEDSEKWFKNKVFGSTVDDFDNIKIMDLGAVNILLFDLYEYLL